MHGTINMLVLAPWWCVLLWSAEGMVLDPALYLLPSPPLVPTSGDRHWFRPRTEREAEELAVLPIERVHTPSSPSPTDPASSSLLTAEPTELMDKSETFWPGLRSTSQYFGSIRVPLTFSLSGTYGRYGSLDKGVYASSYGSISDVIGGGKASLAGTGYGSYSGYPGTRIYGGGGAPSWSGWGNGKWGHYGKG